MSGSICSSLLGGFAERIWKLCFCGASAAMCLVLYTMLAGFFALAGGTLGAILGSFAGIKIERRLGLAIGTAVGALFSFELLKFSSLSSFRRETDSACSAACSTLQPSVSPKS